MNFQDRLERAIERGTRTADARLRAEAQRSLSQAELKNLHSKSRLELSEHIETCLKALADRLSGFEFQSILTEDGWGARISRDDLRLQRGGSGRSLYSRLEITVSPLKSAAIIELVGKATIRNKEVFNRTNYQRLEQIDLDSFHELIDLWVLEFAERFAASA